MRPPSTPSCSATLTSVRTCTPTPSCPVAPPCTPVLLTVCKRKSPPWLPPQSRSRSSLPPRGSTPYGSVAPSCLPSPPSSRCGSPSRSTTSADPPLSTASASKLLFVTYHNCSTIVNHSQEKFVQHFYLYYIQLYYTNIHIGYFLLNLYFIQKYINVLKIYNLN